MPRSRSVTKICAANYPYGRAPFERFLDDTVDLGVEAIELYAVSPHLYLEDATAADLERIRRQIAERELRLVCLTPEQVIYPVNIAAREEAIRVRSLAYVEKAIDRLRRPRMPDAVPDLRLGLLARAPARGLDALGRRLVANRR